MLVLALGNASFAEDCTYDQDIQLEKLNELAKQNRVGVDLVQRAVVWTEADGARIKVSYGGCDHLGFVVHKTFAAGGQWSEADATNTAVLLATRFWDSAERDLLQAGVQTTSAAREQDDSVVVIQIPAEHYSEFYVELDSSARTVEIAWQRNF